MKKLTMTAGLFILFISFASNADLDDSMDQMCSKMKTCGTAQLKNQGLNDDMLKQMVEQMAGMFDGMCKSMLAPQMQAVGKAGLEKKAEACVDSMVETSCDKLMNEENDFTSPECEKFEKAAKDAGIDLDS